MDAIAQGPLEADPVQPRGREIDLPRLTLAVGISEMHSNEK